MINYFASAVGVQTQIKDSINKIETTMVCVVNSVDAQRQVYDVTPVLNTIQEDGSELPRATIISCPISSSMTAKFGISNPFSIGDYVVVSVCKESIESALGGGRSHTANKYFRLLDGVIVGGILKNDVAISELKNDELKIFSRTGNASIILNTNGNVIINADKITINGNVDINGNLNVSGDSSASDHISGGVSGKSHTHGGVTTGGGSTGGPQ